MELTMALYKSLQFLQSNPSTEFDKKYSPGTAAPHAGIYRCTACGDEIGIAATHTLPPQNHRQHAPNSGPIQWQLIVYAVQQK
ncbi:hypothetical protein SB5_16385 [Pseudomonas oryzihabitans]|nr:hypothetical protein SB5_16385 [Pseudomonas psychrotolerans]